MHPEHDPCSRYQAPAHQDPTPQNPAFTRPEAFGQHLNAEISYLIEDSRALLDGLGAVQPKAGAAAGAGSQQREDVIGALAADLLDQVGRGRRLGRCA